MVRTFVRPKFSHSITGEPVRGGMKTERSVIILEDRGQVQFKIEPLSPTTKKVIFNNIGHSPLDIQYEVN